VSNTTDLLVGSFDLESDATITINGNPVVVAAGTYYLRDANAALSLVDAVETALQTEVASATVVVLGTLVVQISAAVALTLTIPASLQAVLGLPANPTVGTTITGTAPTLLWSAGWPGTPIEHPRGVAARPEWDRVQSSSPDGLTMRTTTHGYAQVSGWRWFMVPQARVWASGSGVLGAPGEFARFTSDVLVPGHRFKVYQDAQEGSGSPLTWPSTVFGPYKERDHNNDWWNRAVDSVDTWSMLELRAILTSEIEA